MEAKITRNRGLPKFDTASGLVLGILFGLVLFVDNLWSLISGWGQAFFPFQLGKILGVAVGLGLAVHCIDMIGYYRKNGRLHSNRDRR